MTAASNARTAEGKWAQRPNGLAAEPTTVPSLPPACNVLEEARKANAEKSQQTYRAAIVTSHEQGFTVATKTRMAEGKRAQWPSSVIVEPTTSVTSLPPACNVLEEASRANAEKSKAYRAAIITVLHERHEHAASADTIKKDILARGWWSVGRSDTSAERWEQCWSPSLFTSTVARMMARGELAREKAALTLAARGGAPTAPLIRGRGESARKAFESARAREREHGDVGPRAAERAEDRSATTERAPPSEFC